METRENWDGKEREGEGRERKAGREPAVAIGGPSTSSGLHSPRVSLEKMREGREKERKVVGRLPWPLPKAFHYPAAMATT